MKSALQKPAWWLLLSGMLLLPLTVTAQPEAIDLSTRGPQVGEAIPEFSLPDQHGETRTLESVLGPNGALLLFHRSADW